MEIQTQRQKFGEIENIKREQNAITCKSTEIKLLNPQFISAHVDSS